jgi:YggT family protein
MQLLIEAIMWILNVAQFIVVIHVIMSLLLSFNVINLQNQTVRSIWGGLEQLLAPIYRPIRNMLPATGGLDFAPLVLLFAIFFLQRAIVLYIAPALL